MAKSEPRPGPRVQPTILIERDGAFWTAVAAHPAVRESLMGLAPAAVGALAARPDMLPLAAAHGGFLFARQDALGFVCELHTLFTPEGWGREAYVAGVEALGRVWAEGFSAVTTFEMAANARSRPPATFGFTRCGEWRATPVGRLRLWMLTRAAWSASPAGRRSATCQS